MSQPTLDGMPRPLYPATPARLTTYLDCPRRYRLSYLDRPAPPRGPAFGRTSVGASVHTALARWWDLPTARRTPEAGVALLDACWLTDGFRDRRQSDEARLRSREHLRAYLADCDPEHPPVAVERTVSVRTQHASLWGRVDRIDELGDEIVVVDYKTGRGQLTDEDARDSLALAVYAAGAGHTLRRRCHRVELHHLPTGEVLGWRHTDASLSAVIEHADAVAAELADLDEARPALTAAEADEAFPARVAPRCGSCDVRSSCGPGRSVPAQRPWTGVDAPR